MRRPKLVQLNPIQIRKTGQRNSNQGQRSSGEHSGGSSFGGHPTPPSAHEKERKITRSGNGKGLADHEINLKLLHLHSEENRYCADDYSADFERAHTLLGGGLRA